MAKEGDEAMKPREECQDNLEEIASNYRQQFDKNEADNKKFSDDFKRAIQDHGFDARSNLGQRFAKAHRPGSPGAEEMRKCVEAKTKEGRKTNEAKRMFRMEWARQVFNDILEATQHHHSWCTLNKQLGVYEPFAVIVEKMGYSYDPQGAIRRAANYCDKCLAMGGDWTMVSEMTGELEFYLLKKEHATELSEKWTMLQEHKYRGQPMSMVSSS